MKSADKKIKQLTKLLHEYSRFGEGLTTKVLRNQINELKSKTNENT